MSSLNPSGAEQLRQAARKLRSAIERVAGTPGDVTTWLHKMETAADSQLEWDGAYVESATDLMLVAAERVRHTRATLGSPDSAPVGGHSPFSAAYTARLDHGLPLNRKERFYTGTVLPSLVTSDGFTHLHRLLDLCGMKVRPLQDAIVGSLEDVPPVQFFTEYSFGESVVTAGDRSRFNDRPPVADTPDVVIMGTDWLLAIEAKMFHRPTTQSLAAQMSRQERLINYWTRKFKLSPDRVRHVLLLPTALMRDRPGLATPVVTWEAVVDAYQHVGSPYWLTVLRTALERYEALQSQELSFGGQNEGKLSGQDIVDRFAAGSSEFAWMGRSGGLSGALLAQDMHSGKWRTQFYEVAAEEPERPRHWFPVETFVARVTGTDDLNPLGN